MVAIRGQMRRMGAALALCALAPNPLLTAPLFAATTIKLPKQQQQQRGLRITLSAPGSLGSFTPAAADPRLAAAFARSGLGVSGFRFTPAASPGNRRAVTVAIRARAVTKAEAERTASLAPTALTPTAYNLGVSLGWKRFALSGDVTKLDTGIMPGSREAADVSLSYSGNKWSTRLQLAADRPTGEQPMLMGGDQAYSVDLGGSYSIGRNLELTGGMRYRLERDRIQQLVDERRDSQAVYVGTAFRF